MPEYVHVVDTDFSSRPPRKKQAEWLETIKPHATILILAAVCVVFLISLVIRGIRISNSKLITRNQQLTTNNQQPLLFPSPTAYILEGALICLEDGTATESGEPACRRAIQVINDKTYYLDLSAGIEKELEDIPAGAIIQVLAMKKNADHSDNREITDKHISTDAVSVVSLPEYFKPVPPEAAQGSPLADNSGLFPIEVSQASPSIFPSVNKLSPVPTETAQISPTENKPSPTMPLNGETIPRRLEPDLTATSYPTSLPSLTPIPSPTPTISDPTNVYHIVNNNIYLEGDIVTVVGFLVNGNIGQEACIYMGLCDYSIYIINDDWTLNRNTYYDTLVYASISEKEEDYYIGQKLKFDARVSLINGIVYLDKIY